MPDALSDAEIAQRIKTILRRDLKLGDDIELGDETPFFSAETDLDSLDMLLLVSNIEKEFGIRVPNEQVGQEAFQNTRTLTAFVRRRLDDPAGADGAMPSIDRGDLLSRLPHRPPFRFVDQLTEIRRGISGNGVWSLRGDESFFAGHFPGRPIVPGVLIAEALAQLAGIVGADDGPKDGSSQMAALAHMDVRFEQMAVPPVDLNLNATLTRQVGPLQQFDVAATLDGKMIAAGTLTLNRQPA